MNNIVMTKAPMQQPHGMTGLQYMQVDTDAMHPAISPGDVIEVDMNTNRALCEGIYLIRLCGVPTLRRLAFTGFNGDGYAILSCDNPAMGCNNPVLAKKLDEMAFIGRVKRIWKEQSSQAGGAQ